MSEIEYETYEVEYATSTGTFVSSTMHSKGAATRFATVMGDLGARIIEIREVN